MKALLLTMALLCPSSAAADLWAVHETTPVTRINMGPAVWIAGPGGCQTDGPSSFLVQDTNDNVQIYRVGVPIRFPSLLGWMSFHLIVSVVDLGTLLQVQVIGATIDEGETRCEYGPEWLVERVEAVGPY